MQNHDALTRQDLHYIVRLVKHNFNYAGNNHVPPPVLQVEFIPVHYDYSALGHKMQCAGLPEEFVETIRTGWWTTCLEILPGKERARGRW